MAVAPKILRIGIIQGGRILDERLVRKRENVTFGRGAKNTFVVAGSQFPETFTLFELKGGQYHLNFTDRMEGRVSVDNNNIDFSSLKSQGLVKKSGETYSMPMSEQSRGKVTVGDITLLYQFVTPPPEPAKPQVPATAQNYWLKSIDRAYAGIMVGSIVFHVTSILYLQQMPIPKSISVEKIPERFIKRVIQQKQEKAEKAGKSEEKKDAGPKKAAERAGEKAGGKRDETKGPSKEAFAAASKVGLVSAINNMLTVGGVGGGSAVASVFGQGSVTSDLDAATMGNVVGIGAGTGADGVQTFGVGTGQAGTIGGVGAIGVAGVAQNVGRGREASIRGRVTEEAPEVDGALSRAVISSYVRQRMGAITSCYEARLRSNPNLRGKIVVAFTIGEDGRVSSVEILSNQVSDPLVASCMVTRVRGWVFPKPSGGSVSVEYPFVFMPAQ